MVNGTGNIYPARNLTCVSSQDRYSTDLIIICQRFSCPVFAVVGD